MNTSVNLRTPILIIQYSKQLIRPQKRENKYHKNNLQISRFCNPFKSAVKNMLGVKAQFQKCRTCSLFTFVIVTIFSTRVVSGRHFVK